MNYYILSSLNGGGAEIAGLKLLKKNLGKVEFKLVVLAFGDGRAEPFLEGLPYVDLRKKSLWLKLAILWSLVKEYEQTNVITSLPTATVLISFLRLFLSFKHIAWQHNAHLSSRVKTLYVFCRFFVDSWIADSKSVSEFIEENQLYFGRKNVYHLNLFSSCSKNLPNYPDRKRSDTLKVVSIGRLEEQKNYRVLVDLAQQLKNENIKFFIYGEGKLREIIQKEIDRLHLSRCIELCGFTDNVAAVLHDSDIYIQCSLHEGLCIASLEAMELALPVIATPVGELRYNVIPEYNGFLCKDVSEFEKVLRRLMKDRGKLHVLGLSAQEFIKENYSASKQSEQLEKILL